MARVLVIDDDQLVSRLLEEHLSAEGHEVTSVGLAQEGLETAIQSLPDLIMLDVQLPDATGFQTCGWLRQNPRTHAIPIIMMTGSARYPNQQEIGKRMGANEYILKPFDVMDVGDKVRALLNAKSTQTEIHSQEAPAAEPPVQAPEPAVEPAAIDDNETLQTDTPLSVPPSPKKSSGPTFLQSLLSAFKSDYASSPIAEEKLDSHFPAPAPQDEPLPAPMGAHDRQNNLAEDISVFIPIDHVFPTLDTPMQAPVEMPQESPALAVSELTLPENPVEEAPPAPENIEKPAEEIKTKRSFAWTGLMSLRAFAFTLFELHLVLSVAYVARYPVPNTSILQAASFVAGGWALVAGLLVMTAAVLRMTLDAMSALDIVGLASIPIVLRSLLGVFGLVLLPLPTETFWFHPLDIFEMAAMVILGLALRRRTESSIKKCLLITIVITFAWALTGRGYFRPFNLRFPRW